MDKSTDVSFHIIEFQTQYTSQIIDLIGELLKELNIVSCDADRPDDNDLYRIPEIYKGKSRFWIAIADDDVVGMVGIKDMGHSTAKLKRMFVRSAYHGTGVGQRLLEHALTFTKQQGFTKIELNTHPLMKRAHRFYEKNGFKRIGGTPSKYHYERKV